MKTLSYKIASSFLAILVLLSSTLVLVDTHYCSGKAVDSSIIGRANMCMMDMESCRIEGSTAILESECCINVTDFKFAEVFKKNDFQKTPLEHQYFIPFVFDATINALQLTDNRNFIPPNYTIPLITRDIYILDESFLI